MLSEPLTVGSLFSGIGGIDYGLERTGAFETRWFVEIDPHCTNVLRRHYPGLPIYGDIAAIDWSGVERVDLLAGGFPCQPISAAGKRLAQADARWLWPEFARAIRDLRPRYVLVENVRNLLAVNGGSAFAEVLGDLASLGYDAEWQCIPASAVGAPHRRDRLWLVAYASEQFRRPREPRALGERSDAARRRAERPSTVANADGQQPPERGQRPTAARARCGRRPVRGRGAGDAQRQESVRGAGQDPGGVADPDGARLARSAAGSERAGQRSPGRPGAMGDSGQPGLSLTQRPAVFGAWWGLEGRAAAESDWWAIEPDVGRVAHGVPHRVDRLRALGNAVVPQVVEWIGHRIVTFDEALEVSA